MILKSTIGVQNDDAAEGALKGELAALKSKLTIHPHRNPHHTTVLRRRT